MSCDWSCVRSSHQTLTSSDESPAFSDESRAAYDGSHDDDEEEDAEDEGRRNGWWSGCEKRIRRVDKPFRFSSCKARRASRKLFFHKERPHKCKLSIPFFILAFSPR